LYIGASGNQSGAAAPTTTPTTAPAAPTTSEATTTTTAPSNTSPATNAPTTVLPSPTAPSTTNVPTTVAPAAAGDDARLRASGAGVFAVSEPQATVLKSSADRVLVKITNARGSVDVLVNGKIVLKTKKRVLVLKAKGIGAKRVTVRTSKTK
jgi:hypothetical protein